MSAMHWRKAGVYLLVAVPVLGLCGIAVTAARQATTAQQGSDPVADAARKAREQKKTEPKPKKVFTNEDLGAGNTPSAPPAAAAASPAASSAATAPTKDATSTADTNGDAVATPKPSAPKNDETTWRKRFSEARKQLAESEKELDILQREAQKAQVQFYSDPAKAMKEQYSRTEVTEKDTKIAAKKQEIDQLKQKLADMEDELRRSGGDVGWAR